MLSAALTILAESAQAAAKSIAALSRRIKRNSILICKSGKVRRFYRVAIFLFAACAAFGQQSKTRQVDEALGTRIREIPAQGDNIEYCFQIGRKDVSFYRTGDGVSQYTELLQRTSGMGDYNDQGGTLLFVKKNGEVVARGNAAGSIAEQPTANRVRPVGETGDPMRTTAVTREPDGFEMPDSMQVADRLDNAATAFDGLRGRVWGYVQPIWRFVVHIFSSLLLLFVCLIGLCRYVAKSAANESLVSTYGRVIVGGWIVKAQENAAASTLVLTWVVAIIVLIDIFMWMVLLNVPTWTIVLVWFPILWFAQWLTNFIVPNTRVVSGGRGSAMQPYTDR